MTNLFKFTKEDKRWYIDLPTWEGPKAELEMVSGADTFLDILSDNKDSVSAILSDVEFKDSSKLTRTECKDVMGYGAIYETEDGLEMWLCDVTKFVFEDRFPEIIYYLKV